jgi:hypothetical protein
MKKIYQEPTTFTILLSPRVMFANSSNRITVERINDLDYGGIDEEGSLEPD